MATYKSIRYIVPVEAVEHTDSINALSDVDTNTTAPTDGQILKWNNTTSKWYPGDVEEAAASSTQKAIFGFGYDNTNHTNISNLVSSSGVVATDTAGVGTARYHLAASGYGGDKALFGFGYDHSNRVSMTNLVSNLGVVASDTTGVGTVRSGLAASGYGEDKAIFGFGYTSNSTNVSNLVSNTGVVASDTTGVGTARYGVAASKYGNDKAIFGFGSTSSNNNYNVTNLVSSSGVVATDTTGVGTARSYLAAASYGGDKAIFGFGHTHPGSSNSNKISETNLVSNTGVVASDTTGVGTARNQLAASGYGGDKAIFGYGSVEDTEYGGNMESNITNLVSNTGVVASDQTSAGTGRYNFAAAGYSTTA